MAKKKKFPYKFLTPNQFEEYKAMSKDEIVEALTRKNADLQASVSSKKDSDYLKELNKEIAEYRKENSSDELLQLEQELKALKEDRDAKIAEAIEEQKDLNGGFNDAINANKEHIEVLLSLLPKSE